VELENTLEAMSDFRNAEVAFERGDLATARTLSARAAAAAPRDFDYGAFAAFVSATGDAPAAMADAITELTRILTNEPAHERSLLYRGQIYSRAGRPADAARDFERVLEVNAGNRAAASELRLLRSREGR
jgi:hypothetical protein